MDGTAPSARELRASDVELIADYWTRSDPDHLLGMGVDLEKLPSREVFVEMLVEQLATPLEERQSYCTIWEIDGSAAGHCNVNNIKFGVDAFMHLHVWDRESRFRGLAVPLVRQSLSYFFTRLKLQAIYCEPYALNLPPSRVLAKVGFEFLKKYTTVPGAMNFEQPVNRWLMSRARYQALANGDEAMPFLDEGS